MKILVTFAMTCLLALSASANDFAAAVGFRSNSADAATSGTSISSKSGFGAGVIGFFDMAPNFQIRSGFLYDQRNVTLTASGIPDVDLNMAYIDIPVTAMYKFAEYGGAFVGPVLGLLASKECKTSGGTCTTSKDPESTLLGLQFGASFKFAPQLGAELYYEMVPSEYWKDLVKNAKTVGVNLLFTFE